MGKKDHELLKKDFAPKGTTTDHEFHGKPREQDN
jgi:hypothetical protein